MIGRRGFITGLVSLVTAPAIVRAGSLMPVKQMIDTGWRGGAYWSPEAEFINRYLQQQGGWGHLPVSIEVDRIYSVNADWYCSDRPIRIRINPIHPDLIELTDAEA